MTETRLLLVRHGATEDFETGRLQGQYRDGGLSGPGQQQVQQLAASLSGMQFGAIYSSDLARAVESAAILRQVVQAPLYYDPRLREYDFGPWEGKTLLELRAAHPQETLLPHNLSYINARYGGEAMDNLFARAHAAYSDVIAKHHGEQVMIIAHAHVLSALMYGALGLPIGAQWLFGLEPARTALLVASADGWAFLSRLNAG